MKKTPPRPGAGNLRKLPLLVLLLVLAGTAPLFALDFDYTLPHFEVSSDITSGTGLYDALSHMVDYLNEEIEVAFNSVKGEIDEVLKGIDGSPDKLIGAFASSSVFASAGATQRAHEGYDRFAVTIGPMIGLQLPSSPFRIVSELDNLMDNLQEDGDIRLGLNPQALSGRIGINTSRFLLNNLYLGAKLGYMSFNIPTMSLGDFSGTGSFRTVSAGVTANYQLLRHRSLAAGFLRWRGVTAGTGFIYQRTNLGYAFEMGEFKEPVQIPGGDFDDLDNIIHGIPGLEGMLDGLLDDMPPFLRTGLDASVAAAPTANLDLAINTFTIPLEAVTSIRLLHFLNLSFGLGVDIGFGSAVLDLAGRATAEIKDAEELDGYIEQTQSASFAAHLGGKNPPTIFNPKIMTGLGFSLGPVIIDIPVTFYPLAQGYNLGLSLGVVF